MRSNLRKDGHARFRKVSAEKIKLQQTGFPELNYIKVKIVSIIFITLIYQYATPGGIDSIDGHGRVGVLICSPQPHNSHVVGIRRTATAAAASPSMSEGVMKVA
jgi:hypothetical protein